MEIEKNIYGLSEGVFKACQYLGLKFPTEVPKKLRGSQEHVPSDYFGDNFELDDTTKEKLRSEREWSKEKFENEYKSFTKKYLSQRCFKHNKTDLNIYFCDLVVFVQRQTGANRKDYFNFGLYEKSFEQRESFLTARHFALRQVICNDHNAEFLLDNKAEANKIFAEFTHRDWIEASKCSFEEFQAFVKKHSRFFSKPVSGSWGKSAQIYRVEPNQNLKDLFADLKSRKSILEEVIVQHKQLKEFCPSSVNTLRFMTFLDMHNAVHILTASGRFGRTGKVIDNYTLGGISVIIDPKTGIITSDAINLAHEKFQKHPDTGKTFKGFQYPYWKKIRNTVKKMAKLVPQLRHIGWDITINNKGEVVFVEANHNAATGIQQAADGVGRLHLYQPLLDELQNYKKAEMQLLGYRVNNFLNFDSAYKLSPSLWNPRRKFAITKLIPDCASLMDLGCRKEKFVKSVCPEGVKYYPVDYKKYDDEVIICDFNEGEFPDIKADTCFCALTAEYVELLPQFLNNMCNAAQKQILMWCRPFDKETYPEYRWENPFLTDFTEEFLIKTMEQNNFKLNAQYPNANNPSLILYDFRKNTTGE